MCPTSSCRLCLCYSPEFEKLLDENGQYNEVYGIASIYFDAKLLTSIICLECWHQIETFHEFQQMVFEAQNNLDSVEGVESIAKLEEVELVELEQLNNKGTDYNGDDLKENLNTQFTNRVDTQDYNPFNSDDEIPLADWSTKEAHDFEMQEIDKFNTKPLTSEDSDDELSDKSVQTHIYCKYCQTKLKNETSNLRRHMKLIHPKIYNSKSEENPTEDKYKCSQCEKEFRFSSLLRIHMASKKCLTPFIQCEYCPSKYKRCRTNNLHRHVSSKHPEMFDEYILKYKELELEQFKGNGKFICCTCDEEFERLPELNKHMRSQHPDEKAYRCPYCRKIFLIYSSLPTHVKKLHPTKYDDYISKCSPEYKGNGKFRCVTCGNEYDHLKELSDHMTLEHPEEDTYQCPLCPYKCNGKSYLPYHMQNNHPKEYAKYSLDSATRRKFEMLLNILHKRFNSTVEGDEYDNAVLLGKMNSEFDNFISKWMPNLECYVCKNSFTNYSLLRKHFNREHRGIRIFIPCCDRKLESRSVLVEHIMLHRDPDSFKCEICDKPFKGYSNLHRHSRQEHSDGRDCPHECLICHRRFVTKQKLTRHAGVHFTQYTHFCNICDKGFVDMHRLSSHKTNVHSKPERLCEECGKSFKDLNTFRKHVRGHAGIKPKVGNATKTVYICSECGRKFYHKIYLREHKKRDHENVIEHIARKFACHLCNKEFKYRQVLRAHIASHSEEKPFQCPHCPMMFKQKKNVRRHRKVRHPDEFAQEENLRKQSKPESCLIVKEIVM